MTSVAALEARVARLEAALADLLPSPEESEVMSPEEPLPAD